MKSRRTFCVIVTFVLLIVGCRKKPATPKTCLGPLLQAARAGDVDELQRLLSAGADINERGEFGDTPLHIIAGGSDPNAAKVLIRAGADIEARNNEADTPLLKASKRYDGETISALMAAGADVNAQGLFLNTPLHWAAERGWKPIVETLIENGARVDRPNRRHETPADLAMNAGHKGIVRFLIAKGANVTLRIASHLGDVEQVKRLITEGAAIDDEDIEGRTALHFAAAQGHEDVVEVLLVNRADPNFRKRVDGATPLNLAVEGGHKNVAELLLKHGADVNAGYPLRIAASQGHTEMVGLLIAHGADINTNHESMWYKSDWTPLRHAVENSHSGVVQLLLDKGADPNATDAWGQSLTAIALRRGDKETLKLLLAAGAEATMHIAAFAGDFAKAKDLIDQGAAVDSPDDSSYAPIHYAAKAGNTQIAELLIAAGAQVNIMSSELSDPMRVSPLHLAAYYGRAELARLLISSGAGVETKDAFESTPLHIAASMGHRDIVEILIAAGAKVNAQDWEQYTPLHSAARAGQADIVEFLLAKGADVTVGRMGREISPQDSIEKNTEKIAEQLVAKFGPYSIIITDPKAIHEYHRYVELSFDDLWTPRDEDLDGIDPVLIAHLQKNPLVGVQDGFDRHFILRHLHLYNREYSGFMLGGVRHISCQMIIHDRDDGEPPNVFSMIHGSGNGVIRFAFDTENKTITHIDCEFPY